MSLSDAQNTIRMRNPDRKTIFRFKQFAVANRRSAMKVGTDGVLLGAWALKQQTPRRILDVGTGTGLIALMMAQRFPDAEIYAVEIDEDSAEEAEENFVHSPWGDRLHLIHGDFLTDTISPIPNGVTYAPAENLFDLIICNPPFFTNGVEAPDPSRQQARHEAALTLDTFLLRAYPLLSPAGTIAIILPADRLQDLHSSISHISEQANLTSALYISRLCLLSTVPSKPSRRLLAEIHSGAGPTPQTESLTIHDGNGNFTQEYICLTKDFYLNF